ncbi:MAG: HD domain-containing phosphohydrolase [Desulfobacterales bacterium]|nr:HD domain-containing phosphohydrolase [Desulfobacterales bacterium]
MLNPFPQGVGPRPSRGSETIADDRPETRAPSSSPGRRPPASEAMIDVPLYNSRIIDNYVKLINKRYRHIDIGELLKYAGMTSYEVADQGHWFTQRQINRFHARLAEYTDLDIAREAGRYAASPDAIGVMRQYALGLVGPEKAYQNISKAAAQISKAASYESVSLAPNKVEIVVKPQEGVHEQPFQCENRKGFFEAITLAFTSKLPRLEHPECYHQGHQHCRYILTWDKTFSTLWEPLKRYLVVFFLVSGIFMVSVYPKLPVSIVFPWIAIIFLLLSLVGESMQKNEVKKSLTNLWDSTEKLVDQISVNYNNAIMTNEIGQVISGQRHVEDVLTQVVRISRNRLNFDRGLLLLANQDRTRLEYKGGFGYSQEMESMLNTVQFSLDNPESQGIFIVSFREQKPFLINDINKIEGHLSPRSVAFARRTGTKAFICCPIMCDGQSMGIFAVDNDKSKRPLVQSDLSLIVGIASIIGISIRNIELLRGKERLFRSLLKVLATSIDARDPLTSGHSEKVTAYTLGICNEMGLSAEYREMIRVAALLHDYGKIAIPDAILKKPERLQPAEYEFVKTHAQHTREILEQVDFEGLYVEVPAIAGGHHERYDGTGYPQGLAGEAIPLGARIIAVADFFEAITARRLYREPMDTETALMELNKRSGTFFDPQVVAAFLRYFHASPSQSQIPLAS